MKTNCIQLQIASVSEDDSKDIPSSVQINFDDEIFLVFLTLGGIQWFVCNQPGHVSSECKNKNKNQTNSEQFDDPNISLHEENSCDEIFHWRRYLPGCSKVHHPNDITVQTHNDPESVNNFAPLP